MKEKKIISIVGARPQFIKLAPLSRVISEKFTEIIINTGQHYDLMMSATFFRDLDIPKPTYNLNIGSASHAVQTGNMLVEIEKVLSSEKAELVIVFGDTNSTLAGALSAAKMKIPILHIEAGLRSFNKEMPEEINRVATDHISDYLFAPTKTAMKNLETEGLAKNSYFVGDIMVDALNQNLTKAIEKSNILKELDLEPHAYLLMTIHRPYNVDVKLKLMQIFNQLGNITRPIVFPVHPRTRKMIAKYNIMIPKNIKIIDPVGYLDFICLENFSQKIITDSGGIQKEAYILKKPCLTLRPETEWLETVQNGWNILLNPEANNFCEIVENFHPTTAQKSLFGHDVADKMFRVIEKIV